MRKKGCASFVQRSPFSGILGVMEPSTSKKKAAEFFVPAECMPTS
nr:MAG TPA: hypothetical protein [Caudoviricetes sp.]